VLITSGAFMDQQAVVLDANKKEVRVAILSLGQELIATIEKTKLVRIEDVF
jgi:transcription antitermination factor NusG